MHPLVSTSGESPNVLSLLDDRRRKKSAFRKAEMPGKSGAQRKSSSVITARAVSLSATSADAASRSLLPEKASLRVAES